MSQSNGKDWRELCAAAVEDPDSEKLVSLVNQILQAFDERDQGACSPAIHSGLRHHRGSR